MQYRYWLLLSILFLVIGCSPYRHINQTAQQTVIQSKALQMAHVGISIYEPATNKYWYNYQGDKFFVPASNTKIPTTYAAMKYLGDSLVAAKYIIEDSAIILEAAGDPTFLHPDFKSQPLYDFLKETAFKSTRLFVKFAAEPLGSGWSWNDFNATYMAERDPFPIYGNLVQFTMNDSLTIIPATFRNSIIGYPLPDKPWSVERLLGDNVFMINNAEGTKDPVKSVPMKMGLGLYASVFLSDTLGKKVGMYPFPLEGNSKKFYSQPTDSLLKPLMHRSDNFFAEQTLLMVSNQLLGFMSDAKIIDTLLKTDLKDLPQMPRWVDGSGLSRYNLFTPQSFVAILNKMQKEFGMARLKEIFPAGNDGTLRNYYVSDSAFIWAKTGTLSGVVALSGYLLTKKDKLLLFSVLVNNHRASATDVRRAVEQFLVGVREKY